MTYPGGKAGSGVYQRIINLIPPHRVYIEPFAGGAAVLRHKRPAASTIAVERDARAAADLRSLSLAMGSSKAFTVVHGDGIRYLREYPWRGDEFVYCDPPYVLSTRRSGPLYEHELSDDDHRELVSLLLTIPAGVMVSGYRHAIYDDAFSSWHRHDYQAMTRGGTLADASLWMNYSPPALLHDSSYLGDTFRERERIKRKRRRWVSNLMAMPPAERFAVYGSLVEAMRERSSSDSARPSTPSPAVSSGPSSPNPAPRPGASSAAMLQDLA